MAGSTQRCCPWLPASGQRGDSVSQHPQVAFSLHISSQHPGLCRVSRRRSLVAEKSRWDGDFKPGACFAPLSSQPLALRRGAAGYCLQALSSWNQYCPAGDRNHEPGREKLLELSAGTNMCLLHPPKRCLSHHGRGEAVAVVGEESVEGWERANELLVAGRMFPSKLMCANA